MRNFLIWTLSILLGFEPALFAQGQANKLGEIKAFLEKSEIGKESLTLTDVYHNVSKEIPPQEIDDLRTFMTISKGMKLPKFDIRKMKDSKGKEYFQLQAVQGGQSVTAEIYGDQKQFMRINGKVLSAQDMTSVQTVMAKLGVPDEDIKENFPRGPASAKGLMTFEQLKKMPKADRVIYFKQFRQLLESMEAVENSRMNRRTSSSEQNPSKFEVVTRLLQGEPAFADFKEGDSCIAGGHVARVKFDKKRQENGKTVPGYVCGSNGDGEVATEYRGSCGPREFSCNRAIYGSNRKCVTASSDTTKMCGEDMEGKDIPDIATSNPKPKEAWNLLLKQAKDEAERTRTECDTIVGKAEKKKTNLEADQLKTCNDFLGRYAVIMKWDCGIDDFKGKYKALCETPAAGGPAPGADAGAGPGPETATGGATTTTTTMPAQTVPGRLQCSQLPANESTSTNCENGLTRRRASGDVYCEEDVSGKKVQRDIFECQCADGGPVVSKFKCQEPVKATADGDTGKKKKKKSSGPNWWLIGGAGLLGLLVFNWLQKRSLKDQYQQLEPTPQLPPVPAPVTAPVPRGTT